MPRSIRVLLLALAAASPLRAADDRVEVEAYSGAPFGVGSIRVSTLDGRRFIQPADVTFDVEAGDSRAFYPVFFRESLPGAVNADESTARGALFLFKGDAPLSLKFSDGARTTAQTANVTKNEEARQRLLERWWSQYRLAASRTSTLPVVENYTTHMLARRLGLKMPERSPQSSWAQGEMLGSFLGFEEMRLAMQADRMLDDGDKPEPADLPLPVATLPPAITIPEPGDAHIEPLAKRVPEECFYLRFGSYSNYRWFRDTMNTWGGNLREITATRSLDYDISGRLERQLVLKDSELGKLLGDTAISDMAVIGTDTFVREGASLGVLFREKQPGLLAGAIKAQRAAAAAGSDVTEETVEMNGVKVSLLTVPGNVVRSYYVADGEYHFVTTSSTLARRFLEAGKGTRVLADLKEFQYARSKHPSAKGNPILAYLSDPFIRQMVSPACRVEMTRRMKADADVELVALARLAAIGEGAAHGSVDELVEGGFLPAKFGKRADETLPLVVGTIVVDSLRGARRTFLPVADVLVAGVTKSETDAYQRFAQAYQALYRRMDPVSISLSREPAGPQRERIVLDLSITPFTRQNLGALANWMPPAVHQRVETAQNVIGFLEVGSPQSRLFAGWLDGDVPFQVDHGRVEIARSLQNRPPVFVGEYGRGMARQFLSKADDKHSADGYFERPDNRSPVELTHGREWGDWWAASMSPDVLPVVTPELRVAEGPRPAQVRLHIGDLGAAKLGTVLRAQQYLLERETSRVNARLLDSFTQQLRVADDGARDAAFIVLGAKPVCPLGGEYRRDPPNYQFSTHQPWFSTAWPAPEDRWQMRSLAERQSFSTMREVPTDYKSRLLEWFKGLNVEVQFADQTMLTRIELEVAIEK